MAEVAVGTAGRNQPVQGEVSSAKFAQIAGTQEFRALRRAKLTFIWPVTLLFIVFYLLLPLLAGYAKPLMSKYVVGFMTFGYAYGIVYYVIAWGLAFLYVIVARRFDRAAEKIAREFISRKDAR